MGKRSKTGKSRKDHFYALAKQQGFRARSAFKLTQLANKFRLFESTLNVIDLCAAPGGWMQVARKALPVAGHVFGIDLVPISPIKGCTSIMADITTERCDKLLRNELEKHSLPNGKVELVLHDGAPNVGASWDRDAYAQNELVLKSLELAARYLKEDGKFVTKVFRSADYTKLMYVFQQLFRKVQATKPQSSRIVSAEIFVVCEGFKNPSKISKDLFDLNKVFETVEDDANKSQGVVAAESIIPVGEKAQLTQGGLTAALKGMKKKNRGGYDVGDDYRQCSVKQFFQSGRPAEVLVVYNRIKFDADDEFDNEIKAHKLTTSDIIEACNDLKLCGKGDYRVLLKWRIRILEERHRAKQIKLKAELVETPQEPKTPEQLEAEMDAELESLMQKDAKQRLKALRKARSKFRRIEMRAKIASAVFVPQGHDPDLFSDAARSAALLEDESTLVDPNDNALDEETFDELGGAGAIVIGSSSDEDEAADDEDIDYLTLLEREMDELHKIKKEKEILKGLKGGKERKLKETRRQLKLKEWAAEMECTVDDIDRRNLDGLVARRQAEESTDDDDEDEAAQEETDSATGDADTDTDDHDHEISDEELEDDAVEPPSSAPPKVKRNEATPKSTGSISNRVFFANELVKGICDSDEETGKIIRKPVAVKERRPRKGEDSDEEDDDDIQELSDSELPNIPLCESKRRKLKRKRDTERKEKKEAKKARIEVKMLSRLDGTLDEELTAKASGLNLNDRIIEVPADPLLIKPDNKQDIAEIQAIGALLTKKKSRMDLMDGLFNRWAFDDEGSKLPEWFVEDDSLARIPELPVTKELVEEYKRKIREIAERPIRKVAEAQARKKARMAKRLASVRKQALQIAESNDIGEAGKSQAIKKLMKKVKGKKPDKTYSVTRHAGGSHTFAPRGSKKKSNSGPVKIVDRRLKKDKRAMKVALKRSSKKKRR